MFGRILKMFQSRPITIPAAESLVEGEAKKVDIGDPAAGGKQVVLCRVEGQVYALDSYCPHEGGRIIPGPLAEGRYAVCPLHNYRFDPKSGSAVGVSCPSARTYKVKEENGELKLWV